MSILDVTVTQYLNIPHFTPEEGVSPGLIYCFPHYKLHKTMLTCHLQIEMQVFADGLGRFSG